VQWELVIVLHAGQTVPVSCATADSASQEMLAAVRQVAERHGIPADLSGIAMSDGKPPETGLYEDPGGRAGVRYWDGAQWSPLMSPGSYGFLDDAKKSAARWAALPVSLQPWLHAATLAARWRAIVVVSATLTPALTAAWVLTGAWHADGTAACVASSPWPSAG
jgi:hypothetical protein